HISAGGGRGARRGGRPRGARGGRGPRRGEGRPRAPHRPARRRRAGQRAARLSRLARAAREYARAVASGRDPSDDAWEDAIRVVEDGSLSRRTVLKGGGTSRGALARG